jgi:hypothetical protein
MVHTETFMNTKANAIKSMARLVYAIRSLPEQTQIGSFIHRDGSVRCVQPKQIVAAVRHAAEADNLLAAVFDLRRIGSHSHRSGGAINLTLNGYDHDMIKKLGRWSSSTCLHYIQNSIGDLTTGVATKMATTLRFHRVSI